MKMDLSYEKGFILKHGDFTKNRPFTKKGLFIVFDRSESSHDFLFLSWFVFSA